MDIVKMSMGKTVGITLSGGGFRGMAHVGAIAALEGAGIKPTMVSGTSAGAIVGALYAKGYKIEEMKAFFKEVPLFAFNRFTIRKPGFLDSESFYDDLLPYFPEDSFEHLEKNLFVTATNLVEGTTQVFDSGALIKSVLASAAFPGVFSPVLINGQLYADGGILNNFPIKPLQQEHCDFIIGVDVTPVRKHKLSDFKHSYNVLQRAYYLRAVPNSETKFTNCDLIIQPKELVNFGAFSSGNLDKIYDLGYQEAQKQLNNFY